MVSAFFPLIWDSHQPTAATLLPTTGAVVMGGFMAVSFASSLAIQGLKAVIEAERSQTDAPYLSQAAAPHLSQAAICLRSQGDHSRIFQTHKGDTEFIVWSEFHEPYTEPEIFVHTEIKISHHTPRSQYVLSSDCSNGSQSTGCWILRIEDRMILPGSLIWARSLPCATEGTFPKRVSTDSGIFFQFGITKNE